MISPYFADVAWENIFEDPFYVSAGKNLGYLRCKQINYALHCMPFSLTLE